MKRCSTEDLLTYLREPSEIKEEIYARFDKPNPQEQITQMQVGIFGPLFLPIPADSEEILE